MLRFKGSNFLRRLNLLSSIRGKITFILVALSAVAGGAGYLTYQSFSRVAVSADNMTARDLPRLSQSTALISAASATKDAMVLTLMQQDLAGLTRAEETLETASQALTKAVAAQPDESRAAFSADLAHVMQTLDTLVEARESAFDFNNRAAEMTHELQEGVTALQTILLQTADDAYFNIAIQGEDTIAAIEETMVDLVDNKFTSLQELLETRAQLNLMSGVSLALSTTRDQAMRSILSDLASSYQKHLSKGLEALASRDYGADIEADLTNAVGILDKAIALGQLGRPVDRAALLSGRQQADAALSTAIDDMVFELTIAAEDAASGNRDAIQGLLDNEVAYMNALLEINSWLSAYQIEALKIAGAQTLEQARIAGDALAAAAGSLSKYADFGDGSLAGPLSRLSEMASADQGLAFLRMKSLDSDRIATDAAEETVKAVLKIAGAASLQGVASQETITENARSMAADATEVQGNLEKLGAFALGFVFLALLMNHWLIIRPLNAISRTTERLSQGDMTPVTGFERASDEVRRIANALKVFRDGLVEKEEMARIAEKERAENQAKQTAAVDAIGTGLAHFAKGDLTYRITRELTDGYAKLKDDFNLTASTLNATVVEVFQVADSLRSGSAEIQQASNDLSHRTESQAATLEETAAAIEELTASVRSAAEGSRDAENTTNEARDEAIASGQIVEETVSAMKDIEDSSTQISQIIGVIDDIAFQTNLLALNAGVEAARAGEAGRGFAVVASEVRGLSQRTTDAAREIKGLISKSTQQVKSGVSLVGRTGTTLRSISDRVSHISNLVSAIADSTSEQATGLSEANIAVSQLDQVTQQNAAMVEETSAAGQLLSQDAIKLSRLIDAFTIDVQDVGTDQHKRGFAPDEPFHKAKQFVA
ncbi:methyl-accepting chemotaxis protein [Ruegeria profundi]|uniref:methyl-accepting chemotaxis protein n=1 Tax=Ruegeria profundi TaxID=1685378 RepID=UPI001CD72CF0|nr:methyl-accepting chemotaxis protein [Ruegeria profundi]MCA0929759.1 methyl-accepting chemotaxis protein [Ruegeria profundi]